MRGLKSNSTGGSGSDSDSDGDGDEDGTSNTGGKAGCTDGVHVNETVQAEGAARERAFTKTPGDDSERRGSRATSTTARTAAAVGARAQELAAARFAGMRSAAEARSAAASTATAASGDGTPSSGDSSVSGVASAFAKGVSY